VAESVIRNVSCPVLTIGPNLHERFLNIKSLDIVLVATDLTAHSLSVIPFLVSITAEFRSNVQFLHVLPEKERSNVKLVAAAQSRMEKLCRPYFSARTLLGSGVEFGDPAKNILATAAVRDADLIAIGVRPGGRFVTHLHESVGFQIIAKATCPVLTVKHA
jgi:nucleotide-binding universal stress UspA family protein